MTELLQAAIPLVDNVFSSGSQRFGPFDVSEWRNMDFIFAATGALAGLTFRWGTALSAGAIDLAGDIQSCSWDWPGLPNPGYQGAYSIPVLARFMTVDVTISPGGTWNFTLTPTNKAYTKIVNYPYSLPTVAPNYAGILDTSATLLIPGGGNNLRLLPPYIGSAYVFFRGIGRLVINLFTQASILVGVIYDETATGGRIGPIEVGFPGLIARADFLSTSGVDQTVAFSIVKKNP